jgi:hypothetical protein
MEKIISTISCELDTLEDTLEDTLDMNIYSNLIDLVLDNGFYPSIINLKHVREVYDCPNKLIAYVQSYIPLIDYIIKCDINNITNNKPKNITKNIKTLITLLLIRKYCSFDLPFCVIKHNIIPYIYKI